MLRQKQLSILLSIDVIFRFLFAWLCKVIFNE